WGARSALDAPLTAGFENSGIESVSHRADGMGLGEMAMSATRKLWIALGTLLVVSFGVLLWMGADINRSAPPLPERLVNARGEVIYTRADIERGRQVWQSMGGMELGSIWGHGAYVAPDWSADWLHRESTALLDGWARREAGA